MSRRSLRVTLPALFSVLLMGSVVPAFARAKQVISARAGLVTRAEGEVLYHCHEKGEGVEQLLPGTLLHDGDRVFTTATGRATWSLNPESHMTISADSVVRVHNASLDRMHFDIERGEVTVISRSLKGGASLVIHAPPGLLTVRKPGRYHFRVAENGETKAAVEQGELRYRDNGKEVSLKKHMKVSFLKVETRSDH